MRRYLDVGRGTGRRAAELVEQLPVAFDDAFELLLLPIQLVAELLQRRLEIGDLGFEGLEAGGVDRFHGLQGYATQGCGPTVDGHTLGARGLSVS